MCVVSYIFDNVCISLIVNYSNLGLSLYFYILITLIATV